MLYVLPLHDNAFLLFAGIKPPKKPQTTIKLPTGANNEYLNFRSSPFVASNTPPMYTSIDAIHDIAKSYKNESILLKKIIE